MDTAKTLRGLELFAHFSDDHIETLARATARLTYPAGVGVFSENDRSTEAFIVESGRIDAERASHYGVCRLGEVGVGGVIGEPSFIDGEPRSATVRTIEETVLLALHPLPVSVLMERDLRLAMGLYWTFWKSLSAKLRNTTLRLDQFFGEEGDSPPDQPTPLDLTGEFRIDLATKRRLFEEKKLSPLEINFLSALSRERRFNGGQLIFREGDLGDAMYVVLDGKIRISKHIPGAGEEALAFLERGDFFGEMALIDGMPRTASARAHVGPAVVLKIPGEILEGILDIQKVSSLSLLKLLTSVAASRLRDLDDKVMGWFVLSGGAVGQG